MPYVTYKVFVFLHPEGTERGRCRSVIDITFLLIMGPTREAAVFQDIPEHAFETYSSKTLIC